jgi:hypothetical protein
VKGGNKAPMAEIRDDNSEIASEISDLSGDLSLSEWSTGSNLVQVAGVDTVQLPFAAVKVRKVVGQIVDLRAEIITDKVIAQGILHEQLYFAGTDGLVHHLEDEAPFSTFIDLPGAQPGMNAHLTGVVEAIHTELASDGLSVVKKIIIELFVQITETIQTGLQSGSGPLLLLEQVMGEGTTQTMVENDFILAIPALKIDEVAGKVLGLTTAVIADKVIIQGILQQQIFLIDMDNRGQHQAEDVPFCVFIDLPGVAPGMAVTVQTRLEALFYELITPTLLRQKAIVAFFVKVTATTRKNVSIGEGPCFKTVALVNENTVRDLRETVVTLPVAAVKIHNVVAQIGAITTQVLVNKIIVQGNVHQQIFFIDDTDVERHQDQENPFAVFLDLPGVVPGDRVVITPVVEECVYALEAPTQLRQSVMIAITAVASRDVRLNLALDAGPLLVMEQVVNEGFKQVLVVRNEAIVPPPPVIVSEIIIVDPGKMLETGQQAVLCNQVALPVDALSVKEIDGTIVDQQYWVTPTGVIVSGAVVKDVAFVDLDHVVRQITERVPFSIMVTVPGLDPDWPAEVTVLIENISFKLNQTGDTVEQTLVLQATVVKRSPTTTTTLVTDVAGAGVVQTKIRVRELVLLPDGRTELHDFEVVTAVAGPGIVAGTEQATVLLNVIEADKVIRRPVEVVARVILNEL